jgi:hypothetical protein
MCAILCREGAGLSRYEGEVCLPYTHTLAKIVQRVGAIHSIELLEPFLRKVNIPIRTDACIRANLA